MLFNQTTNRQLINNLSQTETKYEATVGLLNKNKLADNEGLFIPNCRVIHTFFMKFSFTAIYTNRDLLVVKIVKKIKPYRFSGCLSSGIGVIELPLSVLTAKAIEVGHQLKISDS